MRFQVHDSQRARSVIIHQSLWYLWITFHKKGYNQSVLSAWIPVIDISGHMALQSGKADVHLFANPGITISLFQILQYEHFCRSKPLPLPGSGLIIRRDRAVILPPYRLISNISYPLLLLHSKYTGTLAVFIFPGMPLHHFFRDIQSGILFEQLRPSVPVRCV